MKATDQLKAEHEGITLMLGILEKICGRMESGTPLRIEHGEKSLEFFRIFVDRCHHGKEEEMLFPILEAAGVPKEGGPVGQMLLEHELGRQRIREMGEALSTYEQDPATSGTRFCQAAHEYTDLLTQHIQKENQVLFQIADERLTESDQKSLLDGFERLEVEKIGEGKHEEFHNLINVLTRFYGVPQG